MLGLISLLVFLALFSLRTSLMVWDVEFLVFIFFLFLISILMVLVRYLVLRSSILKIWYVYSLLSSLISLNISLVKKLKGIVSFVRFRTRYNTPVFFCYYFLELSKIFSNRLKNFNFFRLGTFTFIVLQNLLQFELRFVRKSLVFSNNFKLSSIHPSTVAQWSGIIILLANRNLLNLNNLFILSFLKVKLINKLTQFLNLLYS